MSGFDRRKSETHQKGGTWYILHTITIVHMEYGDTTYCIHLLYVYLHYIALIAPQLLGTYHRYRTYGDTTCCIHLLYVFTTT